MRKPRRVPFVRPSKLLWVPALGAIALSLTLYGTPHLLWSYHYTGTPDDKTYLDCLYLGRHSQRVLPIDGDCPIILFFKDDGGH
jgi:hypothetical protein